MEEKLHTLWNHRSGAHVGSQMQRAFCVRLAALLRIDQRLMHVLFILRTCNLYLKICSTEHYNAVPGIIRSVKICFVNKSIQLVFMIYLIYIKE